MKQSLAPGSLLLLSLLAAVPVQAQTPQAAAPAQTPPAAASNDVRPATTTFNGDTGLWNVPTGDVLPAGRWSVSAYRVNFDDNQGFTDVSNWPITFGVGVRDRAEIFGAFTVVNRIDRDVRPLFLADSSAAAKEAGGFVPQNPLARGGWSGNNVGDLWLGAKFNLTSQWRQQPAAFAIRAMVKAPTGDKDSGASTGKADFAIDGILSKEVNERVEVSGYAGFIVRGAPSAVEETNGFRWGFGAGFPSRQSLRFTAEVDGEAYSKGTLKTKEALVGEDGSIAPAGFAYDVKSPVNVNLGLTWQHANGFFAGAAWTWRPTVDSRRLVPEPVQQRCRRQDGHRRTDRLSPGRAGVRAAASAAAPAAAPDGAEPSADRTRALRAVHGLRREDLDRLGRRPGP